MNIKSSEFINFRNIAEERIEFSPGVNVIYGENAQGKTHILEGIYIFARGKSFRSLKDKELISFGKSVAYSRLEFENEGGCTTLGVEISSNKPKHFYRNNIKVSKTSEIIGEFRSVLFCPSHLGIISDSPSVRRSFLDVAIAQLRPVYIKLLAKYQNYLLNRNSILKKEEGERDNCLIDTYSEAMAELCADISLIRQEYIKKLDLWVKEFFKDMTLGKETPEVLYDADHSLKEEYDREAIKNKFLSLYKENIEREIKYGATMYGIHKDDMKISINSKDSRLYASQGQQRSLALAMKMAEGEISREMTSEYPVFLLDDVLSELDESRRKYILSSIDKRQVIITSCEPSVFEGKGDNYIRIKDGKRI